MPARAPRRRFVRVPTSPSSPPYLTQRDVASDHPDSQPVHSLWGDISMFRLEGRHYVAATRARRAVLTNEEQSERRDDPEVPGEDVEAVLACYQEK